MCGVVIILGLLMHGGQCTVILIWRCNYVGILYGPFSIHIHKYVHVGATKYIFFWGGVAIV